MPPLINPSTDIMDIDTSTSKVGADADVANTTSTTSSSSGGDTHHHAMTDTPASTNGPAADGLTDGSSSVSPPDSSPDAPKLVEVSQTESSALKKGCDDKFLSNEAKQLIDRFQASNSMVNITIPSGKNFLVHMNLLVEKSSYFRAALTGDFQEAQTKQLTLEDVSDTTFAFYLKWLYSQNLRPADCHTICSHCSECPLSWTNLFDLWFFADYIRTPQLQNHIIQNLVQKINNYEHACERSEEIHTQVCSALRMIWKGKKRTAQGEVAKPLRDLLLDFVGNRQYMTKKQETSFRKGPLPYVFWYEFGRRGMDREFDIGSKCQRLAAISEPFDEERELYDEFEDSFETLMLTQEKIQELLGVWKIVPETYYVEDGDKEKTAKKD